MRRPPRIVVNMRPLTLNDFKELQRLPPHPGVAAEIVRHWLIRHAGVSLQQAARLSRQDLFDILDDMQTRLAEKRYAG